MQVGETVVLSVCMASLAGDYELNAMLLPVVGVRSSGTFITEHAHTMACEFLLLHIYRG